MPAHARQGQCLPLSFEDSLHLKAPGDTERRSQGELTLTLHDTRMRVILVGCGNIGSRLLQSLARIDGPVLDIDVSSQLFKQEIRRRNGSKKSASSAAIRCDSSRRLPPALNLLSWRRIPATGWCASRSGGRGLATAACAGKISLFPCGRLSRSRGDHGCTRCPGMGQLLTQRMAGLRSFEERAWSSLSAPGECFGRRLGHGVQFNPSPGTHRVPYR